MDAPALKGSIIWGARNIAKHIGRPVRATFHLLEKGHLPGCRKIGGQWAMDAGQLARFMRGE